MNGMPTKREVVRAAIRFEKPSRVPIWFFNQDQREGDILMHGLTLGEGRRSEWGYTWETMDDGTMGQPTGAVIPEWEDLEGYVFPALQPRKRLAGAEDFLREAKGYYTLANVGLTGFTCYTFLRGFEESMVDFLAERERAEALLDRIFAFECDLLRLAAEAGFDGAIFWDDWGTQQGLIISPALWRDLFKPRYAAQFDLAHELGLDVWFHSCGNVTDIVADLHEAGVDVMNLSQPNSVDTAEVGEALRGEQCFLVPASYQTVSISGTVEEIHREVRRLHGELAADDGGFIGYVEEYGSVGMPPDNYRACAEAFAALPATR